MMNDSRLRFDLADLAEQVQPVDLRDRALRTSRRLGVQRAAATSAAVLVVLAGAAGIAFAVRPNGEGPAPIPATSPTVGLGPAEPTQTPPVSPPPSTGSGTPSANTAQSLLTGARWYISENSGNTEVQIHAVRGDKDQVTARVPAGTGECVRNTITVSPDGKRMAWVDGSNDLDGTLMIASTGGTGKRSVTTGVLCLGAEPLTWKGSGDLLVTKGQDNLMVNLTTGATSTGGNGQEVFQAWSPDGVWSAGKINDKLTVTNGTNRRYYQYTPPQDQAALYDGWSARGVSMDGRYITVGWLGTSPSRVTETFAVVDTTTGKTVKLPVSGDILNVVFAADGKVLVRQPTKIVVLDAQFHKLGEVTELKALENRSLIAYSA